jgi:CubicO group peptidase (beta-lactamase class C family)
MPRHDMLWLRAPWDRAEVIRRFGKAKPSAGLREKYQYNNCCFLAAGEASARAAGFDSWDAFIRERVLVPAGMSGVLSRWAEIEAYPDKASGHRNEPPKGRTKRRAVPMPWRDFDNVGAAGCLCGTISDYAAWLRLHLSGGLAPGGSRLIEEAALRETHTPQVVAPIEPETRALYPEMVQASYGLGWRVWDYRGHLIVSHGGWLNGFRSHVAFAPRSGVGVASVFNLVTDAPEAIRNSVLDLLLGLPPKDWTGEYLAALERSEAKERDEKKERAAKRHKKTRPSRELAAYTGTYEDAAYGTAAVTIGGGALRLAWSDYDVPLAHRHFDTFTTGNADRWLEDETVQFALDKDGNVAALTMFDVTFRRDGGARDGAAPR